MSIHMDTEHYSNGKLAEWCGRESSHQGPRHGLPSRPHNKTEQRLKAAAEGIDFASRFSVTETDRFAYDAPQPMVQGGGSGHPRSGVRAVSKRGHSSGGWVAKVVDSALFVMILIILFAVPFLTVAWLTGAYNYKKAEVTKKEPMTIVVKP